MPLFGQAFEDKSHAELYNKFRPRYPQQVYDTIIKYLAEKLPPPYQLALDVGCGSGQGTLPLAPFFDSVVGSDISKEQINQALNEPRASNVTYSAESFDSLQYKDGSADLIICAMAIHWFHSAPAFYAEADRVLKPNGCLAVFGYADLELSYTWDTSTNHRLNEILKKEFFDEPRLKGVMVSKARQPVLDKYANIQLPYTDQQRYDLDNNVQMSLTTVIGYLRSRSWYQVLMKKDVTGRDPAEIVRQQLKQCVDPNSKVSDDEIQFTAMFPVYMHIGRKPAQLTIKNTKVS